MSLMGVKFLRIRQSISVGILVTVYDAVSIRVLFNRVGFGNGQLVGIVDSVLVGIP